MSYFASSQSALSIVFVFSGDVGTLIDFFSFAIWTFYGLTFLSTIVLRWRRPHMERPFRVRLNLRYEDNLPVSIPPTKRPKYATYI